MKKPALFVFVMLHAGAVSAQPPQEGVFPDKRPDTLNLMEKFRDDEIGEIVNIDPQTQEVEIDPATGLPKGPKWDLKQPEATIALGHQATAIANPTVAARATPRHPYDGGAPPGDIGANFIHDMTTILTPGQFWECLDYKVLSQECWNPTLQIRTDYVNYYLPYQKIENVDQPFKTGYFEKPLMDTLKDQLEQNFYPYAEGMSQFQLDVATSIVKYQFGGSLMTGTPLPASNQYRQKAIDDLMDPSNANLTRPRRFHHQDGSVSNSGFVFNEYHVLPSLYPIPTLLADIAFFFLGLFDPSGIPMGEFLQWGRIYCHVPKEVDVWFSEEISRIGYSRSWEPYDPSSTSAIFGAEASERGNIPRSCLAFNVDPPDPRVDGADQDPAYDPYGYLGGQKFRTPEDMLIGLLDMSNDATDGAVCQGINQGPWFPPFNTMQTSFHTTAAAVGSVKGPKIAAKVEDAAFYTYSLDNEGDDYHFAGAIPGDNDRVQWLRGQFMDGPDNSPSVRKCRPVEKWVQNYKTQGDPSRDPNMKNTVDGSVRPDHWNVAVHWRYFRCCVDPGSYRLPESDSPEVWNNEYRQ